MRKAEARNVCVIAWDDEGERAISDAMQIPVSFHFWYSETIGQILARKAKMALKLKCQPLIVYNFEL